MQPKCSRALTRSHNSKPPTLALCIAPVLSLGSPVTTAIADPHYPRPTEGFDDTSDYPKNPSPRLVTRVSDRVSSFRHAPTEYLTTRAYSLWMLLCQGWTYCYEFILENIMYCLDCHLSLLLSYLQEFGTLSVCPPPPPPPANHKTSVWWNNNVVLHTAYLVCTSRDRDRISEVVVLVISSYSRPAKPQKVL